MRFSIRKGAACALALTLAAALAAPSALAESALEGWEAQDIGDVPTPISIDFVDADYGWALTYGNELVTTADGGDTWTQLPDPAVGGVEIETVDFVSRTTGWAIGAAHEDLRWRRLFRSTDGGVTWTDPTGFEDWLFMHALDESNVWAVRKSYPDTLLYRSTDGGNNWTTSEIPFQAESVFFIDSLVGLATGWDWLARTTDAGATWTEIPVIAAASPSSAADFAVAGDGTVWMSGGSESTLQYSTDDGATWDVVPPQAAYEFDYLRWDGNHGWISTWARVREGGRWTWSNAALRTTDNGATWSLRPAGRLYDVALTAGEAWACGPSIISSGTTDTANVAHNATATAAWAPEAQIHHIGGDSRGHTAALISQTHRRRNACDTAVVVGYDAWSDALCAAPLAYALDAPLFVYPLNSSGYYSTVYELRRLGVENIIAIGGKQALTDDDLHWMLEDVGGLDLSDVTRIAGDDRYDTSALVARRLRTAVEGGGGSLDGTAYVASGEVSADAMAISPLAAAKARPILLSSSTDARGETIATLRDLGITDVTIVGGTARLPSAVKWQLDGAGPWDVDRIAGVDRYDTAVRCAELTVAEGGTWEGAAIVRGSLPYDGLTVAPLQARDGSVILLTPEGFLAPVVRDALTANAGDITFCRVMGEFVLKPRVHAQVRNAIE